MNEADFLTVMMYLYPNASPGFEFSYRIDESGKAWITRWEADMMGQPAPPSDAELQNALIPALKKAKRVEIGQAAETAYWQAFMAKPGMAEEDVPPSITKDYIVSIAPLLGRVLSGSQQQMAQDALAVINKTSARMSSIRTITSADPEVVRSQLSTIVW